MTNDVPDYFEPILAYRVWSVEQLASDYRLVTRSGMAIWKPYEKLVAKHCASPWGLPDYGCTESPCDGHVPELDPRCGIYGFKTLDPLKDALRSSRWIDAPTEIVGTVWLWGRIVEHEIGYRAQYAYPAQFMYGNQCDAAALAREYGVEYQEDLSWKSVYPSSESLQNLYASLSRPIRFTTVRITGSWNPSLFQFPTNQPPTKSLSSPRKLKEVYKQPSFNLHRPIKWYYNVMRDVWNVIGS